MCVSVCVCGLWTVESVCRRQPSPEDVVCSMTEPIERQKCPRMLFMVLSRHFLIHLSDIILLLRVGRGQSSDGLCRYRDLL